MGGNPRPPPKGTGGKPQLPGRTPRSPGRRRADHRDGGHLEPAIRIFRQDRHQREVDGADQRDPGEDLVDELGGALPGRIPGMKPPYLRMFLGVSSGLKMIEVLEVAEEDDRAEYTRL